MTIISPFRFFNVILVDPRDCVLEPEIPHIFVLEQCNRVMFRTVAIFSVIKVACAAVSKRALATTEYPSRVDKWTRAVGRSVVQESSWVVPANIS